MRQLRDTRSPSRLTQRDTVPQIASLRQTRAAWLPPSPALILLHHPPDQHLPLADVVGGTDHPLLLHLLDQLGGPVVAQVQVPLDEAGAGLALARHHCDRLLIQAPLAL